MEVTRNQLSNEKRIFSIAMRIDTHTNCLVLVSSFAASILDESDLKGGGRTTADYFGQAPSQASTLIIDGPHPRPQGQ